MKNNLIEVYCKKDGYFDGFSKFFKGQTYIAEVIPDDLYLVFWKKGASGRYFMKNFEGYGGEDIFENYFETKIEQRKRKLKKLQK